MAHLPISAHHFCLLFVLSVVTTWAYEHWGSFLHAVIVHAASNTAVHLAIGMARDLEVPRTPLSPIVVIYTLLHISVVLLALGSFMTVRRAMRARGQP